MALLAQQIPRWLNSIKLSSFLTAMQLRKCFPRAGKTLLPGFFAQPQLSSDDCFLRSGFKTYRTSSVWNSSQSTNSSSQEIKCTQNTLLPSVNEPSQKIPSFDSELSLEGNFQVSENSPLPHFGRLNDYLFTFCLPVSSHTLCQERKRTMPLLFICFYYASILLTKKKFRD